jgi:hypothetical protein
MEWNTDDSTNSVTADRRRFLRALGVVGVAGLAGCGGDGDGDTPTDTDAATTDPPTDTTETTDTAGATDTETPTETATDTATPTANQDFGDDPPRLMTLEGGGSISPGGTTTLTGEILNSYLFPVQSVAVTFEPPSDDWEITATDSASFDEIPSQGREEVTWEISAPENADGEYTFTGAISYESNTDAAEIDLSHSVVVFTPGEVPQDGLEAYISFDTDAATNQVTGTDAAVVGEPETDADGVINSAWGFTDNGTRDTVADAVVTEDLPLNGEEATVGAWFNFTSHENYGRIYQIAGATDTTPGDGELGWDVEFNESGDSVFVVNWNGDSGRVTPTETVLEPDTWYFVVTVVDGDEARLYVFDENGQLDASPGTGTAPRTQSDAEPLILMAADGSDTVGRMDEVRAYSRALSEQEVLELYAGSGGAE